MQGKIKVLFFCSVQLLHGMSIFAVIEQMKGVLEAAFRNSRQTVKTRVLGSSLSPSRPNAAILVSERWDRSTLLDLNVHMLISF